MKWIEQITADFLRHHFVTLAETHNPGGVHGQDRTLKAFFHCLVTAAVGAGQESDEFHITLCLKDSGRPYHHGLGNRLRELAERNAIAHNTDVYPNYGSDSEAFWRAGGDVALGRSGRASMPRTTMSARTSTRLLQQQSGFWRLS